MESTRYAVVQVGISDRDEYYGIGDTPEAAIADAAEWLEHPDYKRQGVSIDLATKIVTSGSRDVHGDIALISSDDDEWPDYVSA